MESFDVVLASGAEHLRKRFEELGFRVYSSSMNFDEKRFFPNSDIYVRIPEVESLSDRRVVVIQSCTGSSPEHGEYFTTSDRVQELMLLLDLLSHPTKVEKLGFKKYKTTHIDPPSKVETVLTFQPFALQDKAFQTGEAVSCHVATMMIDLFCDMIWVVSPVVDNHYPWIQRRIRRERYKEIDITQKIIDFAAKKFGFEDYIVVAPDEGAQERFGVPGLKKRRTDSFTIEIYGEVDVDGKNVIVIDDLTKSGSTLLKAAELLKQQGAINVGLVVLHIMPIRDKGEELLEKLVTKSEGRVVTSNSVHSITFCKKNPELVYNVVDSIVESLR